MLHFICVVFHASSAFHVLHISIPILQAKEAEASSSTEAMQWPGQPWAKSTTNTTDTVRIPKPHPQVRQFLSWVHSVNPKGGGSKAEMSKGSVLGSDLVWEGMFPESFILLL